ncbi:alpha-mannosidase [Synechococcus sp. CBW1107]|uniref:alpha-mannosidase n=1 Tax=Synechococcus sp. CBW1107 TaxID=2789857 RepID=UPI0018CD3CD7|nr:alpha-mannosidase [Synechococcus sp. CBW1107]QPN57661.1 alpha-mannosidase [Synechococcus sp. CBW1107]
MTQGLDPQLPPEIETFRSRSRLDLLSSWRLRGADGAWQEALADPWARLHRPDWHARGLMAWPRGGQTRHLVLELGCPPSWRGRAPALARLVLRWWADAAELRVDGRTVHRGDLFDSSCRWALPQRWWEGETLLLELELRSPLHDDGALMLSRIEAEPLDPADPDGLLALTRLELAQLRQASPGEPGGFHLLGHAHLDLAWLWPVADTWQAAERTFRSALGLIGHHSELHFGHSTPALYAWLERHRPELFGRIRSAMRAGRWEPINGPWVETDCVLVDTASLLRQFQEGQAYSRRTFPEWEHHLAWLPDSFGFAAGLPAVAAATGVRWFCTHKLAWNATTPFPHRLFRWRSRCGAEVLALMSAPIGTDGDPLAMERYRLEWQAATGVAEALWLPGVGDHGGGPTREMLEQLDLWRDNDATAPQRHGSLRDYLRRLEPLHARLPVWRDELYLELHRGCATTRPDQKRHNRTLERLLREADLATVLLGDPGHCLEPSGWRDLLFQQFHDILPGTSIPEVFEQAEPQWRAARRRASHRRDRALWAWLESGGAPAQGMGGEVEPWWWAQLQPLPAAPLTLRLPAGHWSLREQPLPSQPAPSGGHWVQLPSPGGVAALQLRRQRQPPGAMPPQAGHDPSIVNPVRLETLAAGERWRLGNGLLWAQLGPFGLEQLWGGDHSPQLAEPLQWRRWIDRGEFWDAWDLAADYRQHPLPLHWEPGPVLAEAGPLCTRLVWRGRCGASALRLDLQLRAGCPWLELNLRVDWRQRHELLRLELPLQHPAVRWAADTSAGVIERIAAAANPREASRWEVPAISWLASQSSTGGLAVLLDGPQGVSGTPEALGVSLLRGPTWPDPGADNGAQRLCLALMPCAQGWRQAGVAAAAVRFREPCWLRPARGESDSVPGSVLHLGHPDLRLISLVAESQGEGDVSGGLARLTVQNLSPCRRQLELGDEWEVHERIDALGDRLTAPAGSESAWPDSGGHTRVGPWQLASWRISRRGRRRGP